MKRLILAAAIAACGPKGPDPDVTWTYPKRDERWRLEDAGTPIDGNPVESLPLPEGWTPPQPDRVVEPIARHHAMHRESGPPGVNVEVQSVGVAGWRVSVANTSKSTIEIVWDSSTFVASNGESLGRIAKEGVRTNAPQMPTPIAAGARITEIVLVEKLISVDEVERQMVGRKVPAQLWNDHEKLRALTIAAVTGGKLHLEIVVGGQRKTWIGVVAPTEDK